MVRHLLFVLSEVVRRGLSQAIREGSVAPVQVARELRIRSSRDIMSPESPKLDQVPILHRIIHK